MSVLGLGPRNRNLKVTEKDLVNSRCNLMGTGIRADLSDTRSQSWYRHGLYVAGNRVAPKSSR